MKLCPNFSIPSIRSEFESLSSIVGEDFAYFVWNKHNGKSVETENPLYNKLLNYFDGNRAKAIYASSIVYSYSFRRTYPEFNRATVQEQLKSITEFLDNSKKDLETLALKTIGTVGRVHRAEVVRNSELFVDRRQAKKIEEEVLENTELVTDSPTNREIWEAYKNFKANPISNNTSFKNMHRTVNSGAFAQWTKDAITLFQGSDFTDLYHESWHEFTQKYFSLSEKAALWSEVKNRPGKVKIGGQEVPYYSLTNRQADEILAEEYRTYALNRPKQELKKELDKLEQKQKPFLERVFEKIYNFLNSLFSGKIINRESPMEIDTIQNLFQTLYEGKLDSKRYDPSNITDSTVNRSKEIDLEIITEQGETIPATISAMHMAEVFEGIDFFLGKALQSRGLDYSFLTNKSLVNKYLPDLYNDVKVYFETYYNQLLEDSEKADEASYELTEDRIDVLTWVLSSSELGDNWKKVVDHHKSFSKGKVLDVKAVDSTEDTISQEEDESELTRDLKINKDDSKVSTELLMSSNILELVKNLPNLTSSGGVVTPVYSPLLGLPTTSDFVKNKNLLLNRLTGVRNYSEVLEIIRQSSEVSPQLTFLLEQLPPSEGVLTPEQYRLKQQFMQSFTMPTTVPFNVKLQEDPELSKPNAPVLKTTTFEENTLSLNSLIENFDQDFMDNVGRFFRNADEEGLGVPTFNVLAALGYFSSKGSEVSNHKQMFDFFKSVFGVDLLRTEDPNTLFNKEGNIIYGKSELFTKENTSALKYVASHAFRKMTLFYKISTTEGLPKSLSSLVSIENISNPMAYFTTDISGKLNKQILALPPDNSLRKYFKNAFPTTSIQNSRRVAFNTMEAIYNVSNSGSFLTLADTMEYSIGERNHLHSMVERMNSVENYSDLTGQLDPKINSFSQYSAWVSKIFAEDGSRKMTLSGEPVKLKMVNFSGFKSGINEGQKTTSLSQDDKFMQDLLSFLHSGVFENIRFGAKATSNTTKLTGSKSEIVFYPYEDFQDSIQNDRVVTDAVSQQFTNYLYFEASRIHKSINGEKNVKNERGSQFLLFHDILEKDTKDTLMKIIADSKTQEDVYKNIRAALKADAGKLRQTFKNELNNWLLKETNTHVNLLAGILTDGDTKSLPEVFAQIVPAGKKYTMKDIQGLMAYYVSNYFTQQVEFVHLIVSDPTNFNFKSPNNVKEIFKRLGPSATPGKEPLIDEQDLASKNSDKNPEAKRLLEKIATGTARDYNYDYNYVVFNDVTHFGTGDYDTDAIKEYILKNYATYLASTKNRKKPNAKDLEQANEQIGESIDATFGQKEESNAQAFASLDFVRFYLDSIGEWTDDQEAAYLHEVKVMEAIVEYRKDSTPEKLKAVKMLIENSNLGIFTSLKLGHFSEVVEQEDNTVLGKYSVFPLAPSVVFNTYHEDRMFDMFKQGTDLVTFKSGNKMSLPAQAQDYYKNGFDSLEINPITPESIMKLPISGLRRQQYIAPKFKNESTLSSQMVKLLFANFYEDGEFNSQFDAIPGLKDKINKVQEDFIKNLELVIEAEKAKIYLNIGAVLSPEGKLVSLDVNKYKSWLTREFDKKEVSPVIYDYLRTNNSNEFTFSLDVSPQRTVFESTISTAVTKRVVKPKLFGEAYIQLASTGFQTKGKRFNKLTAKNIDQTIKKYGLTGVLRDYRVENGKTQPADIAISFNPEKHTPLLELTYKGIPLKEYELPLDTLNEALMDDEWVEQHSEKLILVGVRIPVQKFSSFEYFRIRRFLPTSSGPVIVVPPSIVTKSGSDFDIDKLFMYEPQLNSEGELQDFNSAVLGGVKRKQVMDLMLSRISVIEEKKVLKQALNSDYANFVLFQSGMLRKDQKALKSALESFKQLLEDVKSDKDNLTAQISETRFKLMVVRNMRDKYQRENPEIFKIINEIADLNDTLSELEAYTPQNLKRYATNNIVANFASVLSEASLFPSLIEPNDSLILQELSKKYLKLRPSGLGITSTSMFLPRVSNLIYAENALGKKSLGIDAKTNALHKLYQQTGLRLTNPELTDIYRLKSNKTKDGHIILGGYKDADNNYLISDIINEFINGHVDIEKEDWINYFNADKDRTATILQMVLNGTPIEDALLLVNQPVIQHFIASNRTSQVKRSLGKKRVTNKEYYENLLLPLGKRPIVINGMFDEVATIQSLLEDSLIKDQITLFNQADKSDLEAELIKAEVVVSRDAMDSLREKVFKGDLSQLQRYAMQVALFTQYKAATLQNKALLDFTKVIDFNTATYRNVQDFYSINRGVADAKLNFNEEAVEKILSSSVVSPFNVTEDILTLFNNTFDIIANPRIQEMIHQFQQIYGAFWTNDKKMTETNNLVSSMMHGLIQKYGLDGTTDFYQSYGPKTDHLTSKRENNLVARMQDLKNLSDPSAKKFLSTNLFFQDLNHQVIPNSGLTYKVTDGTNEKVTYDKFIFTTKSNDKHPDTISAFQAYFVQGINYSQSTPEVNEKIQSFFRDLGYATIGGQGFTIKYRSIHPYIPVAALPLGGAIEKIKELKKDYAAGEATNSINEFEGFLAEVISEFSIPFSRLTRNQYTPYKRYFPDFVKEKKTNKDGELVGIEISPNVKGLGAALTNPTEASRVKENIDKEINILKKFGKKYPTIYRYQKGQVVGVKVTPETVASYPIVYKGKLFADVEAAYQAFKNPYLVTKTTQVLMKELIKIKLETYPALVKKVENVGGIELLEKSTHNVKGDKFWESKGDNMFIKTLVEAYREVLQENPTIIEEPEASTISEDFNPELEYDPDSGVFYEIEPEFTPSISRESLPLKKASTSKKDTVLIKGKEFTKDEARLLTAQDLLSMGLTPEEMNELFKQLC
jgi:hypothetical protein